MPRLSSDGNALIDEGESGFADHRQVAEALGRNEAGPHLAYVGQRHWRLESRRARQQQRVGAIRLLSSIARSASSGDSIVSSCLLNGSATPEGVTSRLKVYDVAISQRRTC
jgi:hypothetical protein